MITLSIFQQDWKWLLYPYWSCRVATMLVHRDGFLANVTIRGLVSPRLRLQQKATTQRNRPTWARKRPLKGHKNGCEEGAGRRASVPWVSGPRRHPEIQKITRTTTIGKQRSPRAGGKHKIISTDYDGEDRGQPMRAHIKSVTIPFSTHMKQQNVCAPEM